MYGASVLALLHLLLLPFLYSHLGNREERWDRKLHGILEEGVGRLY